MKSKLIDHAAELRGAWDTPSFMYHLIGALGIHDPEFLEKTARSFLQYMDSDFLAEHDAQEEAEKKSGKAVRTGTASRSPR